MELNKLHNIKNPYQGKARKVLCVCSAGLLRSPTTAVVLNMEHGYNTRAAGINKEYALIDVSVPLLEWADEIVVMEQYMADALEAYKEKIVCLDIPDNFAYMDGELQNLIKERYLAKCN